MPQSACDCFEILGFGFQITSQSKMCLIKNGAKIILTQF